MTFQSCRDRGIWYHRGVNPSVESRSSSGRFVTTRWNMVLSAATGGVTQGDALEELCRAYWYPVYAHVRRRGHAPDDAQDLTQEFFARLLEKNWLSGIEPTGGRFRSFLLTAVNRFLANEYDRTQAAKRGGGKRVISLDEGHAEQRFAHEPVTNESPDRIFERQWAATLMDRALTRLRSESDSRGTGGEFAALNPFLSRDPETGEYAALARALKTSHSNIAVAVHRLRARYRELVREQVAQTLLDPVEVSQELHYLYNVLSS